MVFNITILFFVTFLAGLIVLFSPRINAVNLRLLLVFAGSYLFSLTIIHILPELFANDVPVQGIGIMVLVGFFMQHFLEYFSKGVEHGHMHHTEHQHNHSALNTSLLMVALSIHSFLEGTILAHPSTIHGQHESHSLLLGVLLHKIPAAVALMSFAMCQYKDKNRPLLILTIFALASPLGILVSTYFSSSSLFSADLFVYLFALVSGNFLHISTTIFFESSPQHQMGTKKVVVSILAAVFAVAAEQFL